MSTQYFAVISQVLSFVSCVMTSQLRIRLSDFSSCSPGLSVAGRYDVSVGSLWKHLISKQSSCFFFPVITAANVLWCFSCSFSVVCSEADPSWPRLLVVGAVGCFRCGEAALRNCLEVRQSMGSTEQVPFLQIYMLVSLVFHGRNTPLTAHRWEPV